MFIFLPLILFLQRTMCAPFNIYILIFFLTLWHQRVTLVIAQCNAKNARQL
jgi:hypothetical protein